MSQSQTDPSKNSLKKYAAIAGVVVGLSFFSSASFAQCSIAAWGSGSTAETSDTSLGDRYQGKCGLQLSIPGDGFVEESDSFNNEPSVKSRFYMFRESGTTTSASSSVTVYRLLGSGNSTLADVRLEGDNIVLAVGGQTASASLNSGWNAITVEATQSNASIQVDDGNASTISSGVSSNISGVRLGIVDTSGSPTGSLIFDSYVANRTTAPELLVACNVDGDDDNNFNALDSLAMVDEIFSNGATLADGTPDCNGDGSVNALDNLQLVDLIFNP